MLTKLNYNSTRKGSSTQLPTVLNEVKPRTRSVVGIDTFCVGKITTLMTPMVLGYKA